MDWTPVVIRGKKPQPVEPKVHFDVSKEQKIDKIELDTIVKVSRATSQAITQGRLARGFKTQKDLAKAMNMQADVINAYESGKAIPDKAIIQKFRTFLQIKI